MKQNGRVASRASGKKLPETAAPSQEECGSQSKRTLGILREMILRGSFRLGERLSELPLAARLGASRTPIRLALERLSQEGLLESIPGAGFKVKTYSITDIYDAIALRGVLEGMAARSICERIGDPRELEPILSCNRQIKELVKQQKASVLDPDFILTYADMNTSFHTILVDLARSAVLQRAWIQVQVIPYSAPSSTIIPEAMNVALASALAQHDQIIEALQMRDGPLAENLAREHAKIALTNLQLVLRDPQHGASLITFGPKNTNQGGWR